MICGLISIIIIQLIISSHLTIIRMILITWQLTLTQWHRQWRLLVVSLSSLSLHKPHPLPNAHLSLQLLLSTVSVGLCKCWRGMATTSIKGCHEGWRNWQIWWNWRNLFFFIFSNLFLFLRNDEINWWYSERCWNFIS